MPRLFYVVSLSTSLLVSTTMLFAQKKCTNNTVSGSYAFTCSGYYTDGATYLVPTVGTGIATFSSKNGVVTLTDYTDVTGVNVTEIPMAVGTYSITEECKLTANIALPDIGGSQQLKAVVADQGKKLVGVQTAPPGAVATCSAERMSPAEGK